MLLFPLEPRLVTCFTGLQREGWVITGPYLKPDRSSGTELGALRILLGGQKGSGVKLGSAIAFTFTFPDKKTEFWTPCDVEEHVISDSASCYTPTNTVSHSEGLILLPHW